MECNIFIVTVQTPIDNDGNPNLEFILGATKLVSKYLSKGDIIIYESTVYPGVTEQICGRLIEKSTGLKLNDDFYLAYSPERISPGDEEHHIDNIAKIVAVSDNLALEKVKEIYSMVTQERLFVADSIMEAEAAKLLENLQRDTNIALMNEYTSVMQKLGINIMKVIDAANSKWNFNYYLPGFVGGHCIGVDTHYYIKIARELNLEPKMALTTREVNEAAITHISDIVINHLNNMKNKKVCIAGIAYKKNIDDIRNSASLKVASELVKRGYEVLLFDPLINKITNKDKKIKLCNFNDIIDISVLICLVYHDVFDNFRFSNTMFKDPGRAIVIDPYNKLLNLRKYNLFVF